MPDKPLTDREAGFIDAYLISGDAGAAARKVGMPAHTGESLLERPDIAAEIALRRTASDSGKPAGAPDSEPDLKSLIADARAAYEVAKTSGQAAAMVSAVTLLGRLTDKLDGSATELSQPEERLLEPLSMARAVVLLLQEAADATGVSFKFARPGYVLIEVPEGLAATAGGRPGFDSFDEALAAPPDHAPTLASTISAAVAAALRATGGKPQPLADEHPPAPDAAPEPDGRVTFANGASIAFEQDTSPHEIDSRGRAKPAGRPKTAWAIYQDGMRCGHRLTREDAEQFARSLSKTGNTDA